MKALMVINSLHTGGAEKMVASILPLLWRDGIEVDLMLIDATETPFLKTVKAQFKGKIHVLDGNLYNPLQSFRLIKYFKQYDLVHVHLFPVLYWSGIAKLFGRGRYKLIFTEHSTANNRRNNFVLRLADKIIYRLYDKIVCITDEVKKLLQKHVNLSGERFEVIKNGIDLHAIYNAKPYDKAALGLADDCFVLVQVSSFRYPKDQLTVIRALQHLSEKVILLLVGEGPEIDAAKNLASALNVAHRVQFLGIRSDVAQILKMSDAVILSSAYEGLSLSSLEGLASGKPFVASDVAGLHETVKGFGILFPLGDENRLSAAIIKLQSDANYYQLTAQSGLKRAADFDIEKTVANHIKLYRSLT